jgi:hypothetical protein
MSGRHEIIKKRWIFDQQQHVDILKIILKTHKINENRNGIYVNMSFLSVSTVDDRGVFEIRRPAEDDRNICNRKKSKQPQTRPDQTQQMNS